MSLSSYITGVAHLGIRVRDLDASRAFYESLGFEFIAGPLGPEPVAILEHPSGVVLNLILNGSAGSATNVLMDLPQKHSGYTHVALSVSDPDAAHRAIVARRIEVTEGPIEFPGARAFFIRDPDGTVVELNQAIPAT